MEQSNLQTLLVCVAPGAIQPKHTTRIAFARIMSLRVCVCDLLNDDLSSDFLGFTLCATFIGEIFNIIKISSISGCLIFENQLDNLDEFTYTCTVYTNRNKSHAYFPRMKKIYAKRE